MTGFLFTKTGSTKTCGKTERQLTLNKSFYVVESSYIKFLVLEKLNQSELCL